MDLIQALQVARFKLVSLQEADASIMGDPGYHPALAAARTELEAAISAVSFLVDFYELQLGLSEQVLHDAGQIIRFAFSPSISDEQIGSVPMVASSPYPTVVIAGEKATAIMKALRSGDTDVAKKLISAALVKGKCPEDRIPQAIEHVLVAIRGYMDQKGANLDSAAQVSTGLPAAMVASLRILKEYVTAFEALEPLVRQADLILNKQMIPLVPGGDEVDKVTRELRRAVAGSVVELNRWRAEQASLRPESAPAAKAPAGSGGGAAPSCSSVDIDGVPIGCAHHKTTRNLVRRLADLGTGKRSHMHHPAVRRPR